MNLDRRVKHLEATHSGATQGSAAIAERRERLAPYLDGPRFDGQREAILTALCEAASDSDALCYELRQSHAPGEVMDGAAFSLTIITWPARDSGGAPEVVVFTLPEPEEPPQEGASSDDR